MKLLFSFALWFLAALTVGAGRLFNILQRWNKVVRNTIGEILCGIDLLLYQSKAVIQCRVAPSLVSPHGNTIPHYETGVYR